MKVIQAALLALAVAGCSEPRPNHVAVRAETYVFEDARGASARVFRAVSADGSEALHGETELGAVRVIEDASLDPRGRLIRAEVRVVRGCEGAVEDHVVIEPGRGVVRADAPGGTVEWPVATDAPWALSPPARGAATPIGAWIAKRAAASSDAVRVVRADARSSYRAPADQVAIETEIGTTIMLGEAAASADGVFVQRVAMLQRPYELVRVDARPPVACASMSASAPDVAR